MIEIYKHDKLLCLCASRDWRTFLPGVADQDMRWKAGMHARDCEYTWLWVVP